MKQGSLADYYTGVGFKRLRATEVDPGTSHGHEFQGIGAFRDLFGSEKQRFQANLLYLADSIEGGIVSQEGTLSWYNSRENDPNRSPEFRLYYPAEITFVQENAEPGDLIVVGRKPDGRLDVLIAEAGSTWERQLLWLFAIRETELENQFHTRDILEQGELGFAAQTIIENFGFELKITGDDFIEELIRRFGERFPPTRVFSEYARQSLGQQSSCDGADTVLLAWLEREEMLFRVFEKHLVAERLRQGFEGDVDGFISFSLSVHNRRKSRAGQAMEHHLEQVFREHGVSYSRGQVTENRSRPDFLFPGITEYLDAGYPPDRLFMLGAKTSCKDRWRQVLSEAERIRDKHLFTLEPGISEQQTAEMQASRVQLVLPAALHATFTSNQQVWLMDLGEFLELVRNDTHDHSI